MLWNAFLIHLKKSEDEGIMEGFILHIKKWFTKKQEYFESFARNDTRVESWFKAEMLVLFEQCKSIGLIEGFKRELNISTENGRRKMVDFKVTSGGKDNLCELKAICISKKDTSRNLKFYFRNDDVGLIKDFKKLEVLKGYNKWVFAFIYPKPQKPDWEYVIKSLSETNPMWHCVTNFDDFPDYVFIAIWKSNQPMFA